MTGFVGRAIEAGVQRVLLLLIGYWVLYWLAITPIIWWTSGGPPVLAIWQYAVLIGIDLAAAAVLINAPVRRATPGRFELPVAVAICTLAFFLERLWFLQLGNNPGATPGALMHAHILRQDYVLLLLLVAWQFRFVFAALYVVLVTVVEWVMVLIADLANPLLSNITFRELLVRAIIFMLIGYAVHWLANRQRNQSVALFEANAKLARQAAIAGQLAASQERNRLARELHDTLAHTLSAVGVQLEAVTSLWDSNTTSARQMLSKAHNATHEGMVEARRALHALRATPLETFGLKLSLQALADGCAARCGATLNFACDDVCAMPEATEHAVYRIAQEALENVVRHSSARAISVSLRTNGRIGELGIRDDGAGFVPETAQRGHYGLQGMKERAQSINATLVLQSAPGSGTQVTLRWPCAEGA